MVRIHPGPPLCAFEEYGALAQLGERLLCKHQVIGSIPIGSTTRHNLEMKRNGSASAEIGGYGLPYLTL